MIVKELVVFRNNKLFCIEIIGFGFCVIRRIIQIEEGVISGRMVLSGG